MRARFTQMLDEHQRVATESFAEHNMSILEQIVHTLTRTLAQGGKILLCGNGGSAADAQHIAAEFIGRFKRERKSLPAIALTTDTSILTAVANDYSYDLVFRRQVEALGARGDALIGISTSGNSRNVIEAVKAARELDMATIGFTGAQGGALAKLTSLTFRVASTHTPHIQEVHTMALHAVSELVEDALFVSAPS